MIWNMRRRKKKVSLTWHFNETLVNPGEWKDYFSTEIGLTDSAGTHFNGLTAKFASLSENFRLYEISYRTIGIKEKIVYTNEQWESEMYRTVTFDELPTGELLTFLQANATPL